MLWNSLRLPLPVAPLGTCPERNPHGGAGRNLSRACRGSPASSCRQGSWALAPEVPQRLKPLLLRSPLDAGLAGLRHRDPARRAAFVLARGVSPGLATPLPFVIPSKRERPRGAADGERARREGSGFAGRGRPYPLRRVLLSRGDIQNIPTFARSRSGAAACRHPGAQMWATRLFILCHPERSEGSAFAPLRACPERSRRAFVA